jgi:hypothetical protein
VTRDWLAAVAWWRTPPPMAEDTSSWKDFVESRETPVWVDTAYLSTTQPPTLQPGSPEHLLSKDPDGTITCTCGLAIPQPDGMPNYDGAAMGDW